MGLSSQILAVEKVSCECASFDVVRWTRLRKIRRSDMQVKIHFGEECTGHDLLKIEKMIAKNRCDCEVEQFEDAPFTKTAIEWLISRFPEVVLSE